MEQFLTEALDAFDEDDTRRPEDSVAHGQTTQVANRMVAGRDKKAQEAHACSLGSVDGGDAKAQEAHACSLDRTVAALQPGLAAGPEVMVDGGMRSLT